MECGMTTPARMELLSQQGDEHLARVFVARFRSSDDHLAEFVDARDPERPADEKWVIIISTQFGCPIDCPMCDAGGSYRGDLTAAEMFAQIDAAVALHGRDRLQRVEKFKVQFARMGEPSLNPAVLDVFGTLPEHYDAPGLMPCIATTAPAAARGWLEELCALRHGIYGNRSVQLQLSLNATDSTARDRLMPAPKCSFAELGDYTRRFHVSGTRKVALNFAVTAEAPIDPAVVAKHFDPACCVVKLTPLNPTARSAEAGLVTALPPEAPERVDALCRDFAARGYEVILSIGDTRENEIGSNCGMAVRKMMGS